MLKTLKHEKIKEANLSFVFVSDIRIKHFNQKFLGRAYATDVLAFDLSETKNQLVGDVIISIETVVRNAKSFGNPFKRELTLCVIHGILHLVGYDDHTPGDIQKMRAQERKVLDYLER